MRTLAEGVRDGFTKPNAKKQRINPAAYVWAALLRRTICRWTPTRPLMGIAALTRIVEEWDLTHCTNNFRSRFSAGFRPFSRNVFSTCVQARVPRP